MALFLRQSDAASSAHHCRKVLGDPGQMFGALLHPHCFYVYARRRSLVAGDSRSIEIGADRVIASRTD